MTDDICRSIQKHRVLSKNIELLGLTWYYHYWFISTDVVRGSFGYNALNLGKFPHDDITTHTACVLTVKSETGQTESAIEANKTNVNVNDISTQNE
jgi:hypothetical protein